MTETIRASERFLLAAIAIFVAVALCGCDLRSTLAPPEGSEPLTAADIAFVAELECGGAWTGDPAEDKARALLELQAQGITITDNPGNPFSDAMAKRDELWVAGDFFGRPLDVQARILAHELVHYCQRDLLGDDAFDEATTEARGRWRAEVPAYLETFRVLKLQGASRSKLHREMRKRVVSMRATYLLKSIPAEQYEAETMAAWLVVIED